MTWWEFGEHSGFAGGDLDVSRITCAFCNQDGNFERAHHLEKQNKGSGKQLNFDTLRCGNCGNFIMVFWSAAQYGGPGGIHDFKTLPWPRNTTRYPEYWPEDVGRHWLQARRSLEGKNW